MTGAPGYQVWEFSVSPAASGRSGAVNWNGTLYVVGGPPCQRRRGGAVDSSAGAADVAIPAAP